MKKNIKKVSKLIIILAIISTITMLLFGKTYTIKFIINDKKNYKTYVENDTGEIKILKEWKKNNQYFIKVKGKKSGSVFIKLENNDISEIKRLYIHKNLIITSENFFGKTTASEIIPISLSVILIYILFLTIKEYRKNMKENIYQYKNVAYLGLIIYTSFFTISNIISIFNYQGLFETINKFINLMAFISIFLFPIAFITFILVTISNIRLIIKEGKSLRNLLGLFLGIFICLATVLPDYIYGKLLESQKINIYNLNSIGPYIYNFIETTNYFIVSYLECIIIGTIIISLKSIKKKVSYNKDYIIILGCQIKKDGTLTPLLRGRVDKAIEFRNNKLKETGKDIIFIPSGGKGNDEIITEAEAIKNYLLEQKIPEKNILIENKSKNTEENIKFSMKLINNKNANIIFSTTNYHVFRTGLLATNQGLKLEGIGSKTKQYFWINAFIREFIGTIYSERKKHIIVFIIGLCLIIFMISITYLANNI